MSLSELILHQTANLHREEREEMVIYLKPTEPMDEKAREWNLPTRNLKDMPN